MRARTERQSGDETASDALCESAARRGGGCPQQQEPDHKHHAEHVGEREPRLEPEQRRRAMMRVAHKEVTPVRFGSAAVTQE